VKKDLHRISHARIGRQATRPIGPFARKYRKAYPGAVKSLESEIDDLLVFLSSEAFFEGETGVEGQGDSASPDDAVAQDPGPPIL